MKTGKRRAIHIWGQRLLILLVLFVIVIRVDWLSLFDQNLRWLNTTRAIPVREQKQLMNQYATITDKVVVETVYNWVGREVIVNSYPIQISSLAWSDQLPALGLNWEDTPGSSRGLVHLWSAIRMCNQAHNNRVSNTEACQLNFFEIGNTFLNHSLLPNIHQWNCHQIMDWLVLSNEVDNSHQHLYWQERLQDECPDYHTAYLAQNANGQIQVAHAYARLGLYNRAIAIGEAMQNDSKWSWGHFILAGFYLAIDALPEAEAHLRAAIATSEREEHVSQYHFALAELYRRQDRIQEAADHYCLVFNAELGNDEPESLKARAELSLREMSELGQIETAKICVAH